MRYHLLALALITAGGPLRAADVERLRINADRAAVESRYRAAEAQCQQRFVVVSCVDEAKAQRRKELAALRERELIIDDADRKQRAAARRDDIANKETMVAARAASAAAAMPKASAPRGAMPSVAASHVPHGSPAPRAPIDGGAAQAAERAAHARQRQQAAQIRRAHINAQEKKKAIEMNANPGALRKAAPLPVLPVLPASTAASTPQP